MAMRAAIKKVLSPISENTIIVKERRKEWRGCMREPGVAASKGRDGANGFRIFRGSFLDDDGGRGGGMS